MSINFDRIAARYDETRGGLERGAEVAGVIAPHLPADGRLLEIGIGTGLVGHAMGREVVGIDISEEMLGVAQQRGGLHLARADGAVLPFATDAFVGGYAVWVLHLVQDRHTLLTEVGRVLRPGAPFVVEIAPTFPSAGDEIQAILEKLYSSFGSRYDTPEALAPVASEVGMPIEQVLSRASTFEQTPAEVVSSIEAKTGAVFWRLTDDEWRTVVEPALAALRALPDPDAPRLRNVINTTLVFTAV